MKRIVVIGAGVGGLTAAALLAKAGMEVTVLEAQVYPGGTAGTFFHQGYRFDAGATLAAGFSPGGPLDRLGRMLHIQDWGARPADLAMQVHLPGGKTVSRWGSERRFDAYREAFGDSGDRFWEWQESTAEAVWDLAMASIPWPPQSILELNLLLQTGANWMGRISDKARLIRLAADALRPVSHHMRSLAPDFRQFIDGQLLIAAQTTSDQANALYGASALDLPRRGVVHLEGGMGTIAERLVQAVTDHGGQVLYRQKVKRIGVRSNRAAAVENTKGEIFQADIVIANLTPWNLARISSDKDLPGLRKTTEKPPQGWGAFTVYAGLDEGAIGSKFSLHHQVIEGEPLGEGNSVFLSLSPDWDARRAPHGKRALTISTHTRFAPWWDLYENNRPGYEASKLRLTERMLRTASIAIPGLVEAAEVTLPGTPVTFERYTGRAWGWVGGYPMVNLFQHRAPRIEKTLWMVGDSIFPGQSVPAVALGGMHVAQSVLESAGAVLEIPAEPPA
jgi:C-3',4' desaturase CrtD